MSEFNGMITLTQLLDSEIGQGRGIESIKTFYAISLNGEGPPQGGSIVAIIDKENLQLKDEDGETILDINTENKLEILLDKFFFIEGETLRILEKIWTESIPAGNLQGYYIWSRMLITYTDGDQQEIFSVNYMGHDGETISKTKIFYALSDDIQEIPSENTWVSKVPDNLQGGKYLWTITRIYYSNGSYIDNYSIAYQGKDGDGNFIIETNQEEILRFKSLKNLDDEKTIVPIYSPEDFTFKIFNIPRQEEEEQIEFKTGKNDYKLELIYKDNSEAGTTKFKEVIKTERFLGLGNYAKEGFDIENADIRTLDVNTVYFNIKKYISYIEEQNKDLSEKIPLIFPLVFRFSYIENDIIVAVKVFEVRDGVSEDMATFSSHAAGITAAIQNTKLDFSADGLKVFNGGIKVYQKTNNLEKIVFESNTEGNLYLEGEIIATSGIFNGTVYASDGEFNGKIVADSGLIGGLIIENDKLSSNNGQLLINGNGKIYSQNITLGENAKIEKYIQLGDAFIYNPSEHVEGLFLSAGKTSLKENGELNLGNITLSGENSTIKAKGSKDAFWEIKGDGTAQFKEIVVDKAAIKNSVFEIGTVQTIGSLMLFKDSWKIEKIEEAKSERIEEFEEFEENEESEEISENSKIIILVNSYEVINLSEGDYITKDGKEFIKIKSKKGNAIILSGNGLLEGDTITKIGKEGDCLFNILGEEQKNNNYPYANSNSLTISQIDNIKNNEYTKKLILGKLPDNQGFGLKADNVFLNGTLTTEVGNASYAGVNTLSGAAADIFGKSDNSKIVFWAGSIGTSEADIQKAKFQVTEAGSIYANQGIFEGSLITKSVIKGASIHTAKLYGEDSDGKSAALQIYDAAQGIQFMKGEKILLQIDKEGLKSGEQSVISITQNVNEDEKISFYGNGFNANKRNKSMLFIEGDGIGFNIYNNNNNIPTSTYQRINFDKDKIDFVFDIENSSPMFGLTIQNNLVTTHQNANFLKNIYFGESNLLGSLEYQPIADKGYNLYVR